MSQLPPIDYQKVAQRLSQELATTTLAKSSLEILAEALRSERDNARAQLEDYKSKFDSAKGSGDSNAA